MLWRISRKDILISNFRRVPNVVYFLLGNSQASKLYMPTFRNTLFHLHRRIGMKDPPMKMEYSVPKRRYIKFRRRGFTQKNAYKKERSGCFLHPVPSARYFLAVETPKVNF